MKKLLLASLLAAACQNVDSDKVDAYAKEYATHFPGSTGVECAKSDTDGDGYVTCTVFMGSDDPISIQCGARAQGGLPARQARRGPLQVHARRPQVGRVLVPALPDPGDGQGPREEAASAEAGVVETQPGFPGPSA